jgi:LPS sulfotransferase NodH
MKKMGNNFFEKNDVTLILVCGTARSGSTMLDVMLGNAPDAFSCGEVSSWFRPYRKQHFQIECHCGQRPCPIWEKIKDIPENIFHASMAKELKGH